VNPLLRSAAAHVVVASLVSPELDEHDAHHVFRVLRLREGSRVTATDGAGRWVECLVVGRDALEVAGDVHTEPAVEHRLGVAFVPVKAERPENTVRQLVEVGIDDIYVLQPTKRAVAGSRDRLVDRVARITREACMQSRRVHVPTIHLGVELGDLLTGESVAVADPEAPPLQGDIRLLVVGPEGGFAPEEVAANVARAGIGPAVLRAETAAVAAGVRLVALHEARHGRQ
jgi:16S rRNA (uracil1498-N3)-methyltransferase